MPHPAALVPDQLQPSKDLLRRHSRYGWIIRLDLDAGRQMTFAFGVIAHLSATHQPDKQSPPVIEDQERFCFIREVALRDTYRFCRTLDPRVVIRSAKTFDLAGTKAARQDDPLLPAEHRLDSLASGDDAALGPCGTFRMAKMGSALPHRFAGINGDQRKIAARTSAVALAAVVSGIKFKDISGAAGFRIYRPGHHQIVG